MAEEVAKANTITKFTNIIDNLSKEVTTENGKLNNVKNNLAEAIYAQSGLSLQEAYCKEKIVEAQLFEQSTIEMMQNTQKEIDINETNQDNEIEKTNSAQKDKNEASENKVEKQALFLQTEKEVEKQYQKQNKQFFA